MKRLISWVFLFAVFYVTYVSKFSFDTLMGMDKYNSCLYTGYFVILLVAAIFFAIIISTSPYPETVFFKVLDRIAVVLSVIPALLTGLVGVLNLFFFIVSFTMVIFYFLIGHYKVVGVVIIAAIIIKIIYNGVKESESAKQYSYNSEKDSYSNRQEEKKESDYDQQKQEKSKPDTNSHLFEEYKILELDYLSTKDEVKKMYKKLVKKYHPDKYMNADEWIIKEANEKLKKINAAYEKIMDNAG